MTKGDREKLVRAANALRRAEAAIDRADTVPGVGDLAVLLHAMNGTARDVTHPVSVTPYGLGAGCNDLAEMLENIVERERGA